jgi:hypothetical protein
MQGVSIDQHPNFGSPAEEEDHYKDDFLNVSQAHAEDAFEMHEDQMRNSFQVSQDINLDSRK